MDKEEFRIKLEEINHLVEVKDYKGAMNVVDSIDWRRVKNVRTLCVVGEIYAANKRYEDSREIFLLAYHRAPIGKNILYRLIEVSLKMGEIEDAKEFYQEYKEVAANDNNLYILRYKILSAKNAPLSEQIKALEEYKEREFTEKWSYELAKLYYQTDQKDKCLELCNDIILWFNEGSYVMKAMDLKLRMGALTGAEKERFDQQFVPKLFTAEEAQAMKSQEQEEGTSSLEEKESEEKDQPSIESISIRSDRDLSGVESLQERISKGFRDIFGSKKTEEDDFFGEGEVAENGVPEELIKKNTSEKEFDLVKELEPENGKAEDPIALAAAMSAAALGEGGSGETMKMPELKIPESMKNFEGEESPKAVSAAVFSDGTDSSSPDFNLEDMILSAATKQGIQIPKTDQEEPSQEKASSPKTETPSAKPVELEEEEFLSEEDLRAAEEEFLNGPKPTKKEEDGVPLSPKKREEMEIPRLEEEEIFRENYDDEDVEIEDVPQEEKEYEDEDLMEDLLEEDEEPEEQAFSQEEELEKFIDSIQPKEERDPLDIVPRKETLTEEEKKLFTYFVKVPGMKEQLGAALLDAQLAAADKTSRTGNIIVMGGRETGKTRLIASLIPAICKERNIEASKVAYVFAEQINGKDIPKIVEKLSGGFLVIENANQLDQETVKLLDKAMEFRTDGLTVILEDEKIGMRKLMARFPKFAKKFSSIINIPVFTNDELVNFARVYTKENGYRIDQMGMLALYNLIGVNQKEDEPMNIGSVKDMLDAAITKSQGGLLKFNKKKRLDRDGYYVLYEKDFA